MSDHHPHGPSTLPKLAKCIYFLGGKTAGEAAGRGTMLHQQIATYFSKKETKVESFDASARRGISRAYRLLEGGQIMGVEEKFTLGEYNYELTFGTVDLWGFDADGNLTIVDFKSGAMMAGPEAYLEQLAAYGLMVMDREGHDECRVVIIPLDDDETEYHEATFTREQAEGIVLPIFERIEAGKEEPQENDGCNWCARRETCSVWLKPAEATLTLVDALPATITREWIEASPQNAGLALTAFKKLEGIFDDLAVKDRIKEALESGEQVPGWKLQRRKGSERLDTKAVKARWAELTDEPIPATISEETVSLVAERRAK